MGASFVVVREPALWGPIRWGRSRRATEQIVDLLADGDWTFEVREVPAVLQRDHAVVQNRLGDVRGHRDGG